MVLRTYLDKTNTIVSNSKYNTGKNPVSELFYGADNEGNWTFSRLMVHFDIDKLKKQYDDGMLGDLTKVKHTLNLINTGAFHDDLLNKSFGDKKRTSSFKLVAYELPTNWDEGVGYDYYDGPDAVVSDLGSNWYNAKTGEIYKWGTPGALNTTTVVAECNFTDGNENLKMDVTQYVNNLIKNYDPAIDNNYGLIITFESGLETEPTTLSKELIDRGVQYVGFFTNNTQTFYEPFIETRYESYIRDDRRNFHLNKTNRLYMYVNANGEPKNIANNLDIDPPVVEINDVDLGLEVKQEKKGVYYVELLLTEQILIDNNWLHLDYFNDTWKNIKVNIGTPENVIINPDPVEVNMGFEIKSEDYFNIGLGDEKTEDYKMVISGLRHNETIQRGDIRRIKTNALVPYTVDQKVLLDGIYYRLYVKEGNMEHTVISDDQVERSYKDNYILLDTSSLLPNVYYLDIKMVLNEEVKTTKEIIKFEIVE